MERRYNALRYFAYSIEILLFYVIQGIPNVVPSAFGSKPCLLIPVAITIAMFEQERAAMIFGAICGILTDIGYDNRIGYFAITLCIICFFIGFVSQNVIVINVLNASIIGLLVVAAVLCLHFLLFHVSADYARLSDYFVKHYVARIVYTFLFVPAFYYLNRLLSNGMRAMD